MCRTWYQQNGLSFFEGLLKANSVALVVMAPQKSTRCANYKYLPIQTEIDLDWCNIWVLEHKASLACVPWVLGNPSIIE